MTAVREDATQKMAAGEEIRLEKYSFCGNLHLSYGGRVLRHMPVEIQVVTRWTETGDYELFCMNRGDPVYEHFYPGRWYNVLQLMDRDLRVRGWYCDICLPPDLQRKADGTPVLQYRDLALDIFVDTGGSGTVLDAGEFRRDVMPHLSQQAREKCRSAVREILHRAGHHLPPFSEGGGGDTSS